MHAELDYEELGGLSDPGHGTAHRHRVFGKKGWYMNHPVLPCIYSVYSRTSWSTRKLPDPLGVEL